MTASVTHPPPPAAPRLGWLAWLLVGVCVLVPLCACELPSSTRVPIATRVVIVETTAQLESTIATMRGRGCVLRLLEPSPTEVGSWAVFECLTLPMESVPVQELPL